MSSDDDFVVSKLSCPRCRSRLDVLERASGGRTVSVTGLGAAVEHHALALERFQGPGAGPEIVCPACEYHIDPAAPFRARLFGYS
jgi:DNA-directed RNA polymerase subunit RPC12/RpoP